MFEVFTYPMFYCYQTLYLMLLKQRERDGQKSNANTLDTSRVCYGAM